VRIRHGGELRQFSEKYKIPEREVLDLSSNINPLGPPEGVKEVYDSSFKELQVYPDPDALEFRREVARHFPLWPENVIAGNGAVELLDVILRFLRPKKALLVEPTFLEYRRLLNLLGTEVWTVSLKEKDAFRFSLGELLNALRGVDVIILAHPNNPTGTALAKDELLEVIREARRRNIFVVVDEAFVDWAPDLSLAREVRDDTYFFVTRSLTKFFALPGIRIGYGLGSRKLVEKLSSHQVPWSCNRLAQKLGIAALRDEEFGSEARQWLTTEREALEARLAKIPWVKAYPSVTNFLLVRAPTRPDDPSVVDEMAKRGIYVRDLTEFPGLGPSYFRVAVKKREENLRLIEALKAKGASIVGSTI